MSTINVKSSQSQPQPQPLRNSKGVSHPPTHHPSCIAVAEQTLYGSAHGDDESSDNVFFVGNLGLLVTEQDVSDLMSDYGVVINVQIKRNDLKQSLGYGFAEFKSFHKSPDEVLKLNNTLWRGRTLSVAKARVKETGPRHLNAHVINSIHVTFESLVPHREIDEEVLMDTFAQFGAVTDIVLKSYHKCSEGKQSGYAFVHFEPTFLGMLQALETVRVLHNQEHDDIFFRLEVTKNFLKPFEECGMVDTITAIVTGKGPATSQRIYELARVYNKLKNRKGGVLANSSASTSTPTPTPASTPASAPASPPTSASVPAMPSPQLAQAYRMAQIQAYQKAQIQAYRMAQMQAYRMGAAYLTPPPPGGRRPLYYLPWCVPTRARYVYPSYIPYLPLRNVEMKGAAKVPAADGKISTPPIKAKETPAVSTAPSSPKQGKPNARSSPSSVDDFFEFSSSFPHPPQAPAPAHVPVPPASNSTFSSIPTSTSSPFQFSLPWQGGGATSRMRNSTQSSIPQPPPPRPSPNQKHICPVFPPIQPGVATPDLESLRSLSPQEEGYEGEEGEEGEEEEEEDEATPDASSTTNSTTPNPSPPLMQMHSLPIPTTFGPPFTLQAPMFYPFFTPLHPHRFPSYNMSGYKSPLQPLQPLQPHEKLDLTFLDAETLSHMGGGGGHPSPHPSNVPTSTIYSAMSSFSPPSPRSSSTSSLSSVSIPSHSSSASVTSESVPPPSFTPTPTPASASATVTANATAKSHPYPGCEVTGRQDSQGNNKSSQNMLGFGMSISRENAKKALMALRSG